MSRSVLLQLARDSIEEVIEAQRKIQKQQLLDMYPLLKEQIKGELKLYLHNKLRGSYSFDDKDASLIDAIILSAKKAAFEDQRFSPLSTSEYLDCEVELLLYTPDGVICQKDPSILTTTTFKIENLIKEF